MAIGVDTHREAHVAVAVDRLGRRLGTLEFGVDEQGFAEVMLFARSLGEPAFAIEGTGSYGASLARALLAAGVLVFECERPERRRGGDKNDLVDAELAARRLLAGRPLALPRGGQEREQLRLLLVERRSARHARQQALNQLRAAIITLDPPLRARLARHRPATLAGSASLRRRPELAPLRRLARRIVLLERELAEIDHELAQLTRTLCPRLLAEDGVGPVCAAQLLVSTGEPQRIRTEAAFAALAGVSPIEASSGPIKRHRLNRGGDRQLNWALHMSALNRIGYHPETRRYYQRQLHRGKTKREAIRITKRALARRLYRTLTTATT
ncbi:MAG TPA: IS110 family transposase [Gaiellaceae bacterium]